ncbi:MAG: hypothetical protein FJY80_14470 [Candidatus Aminicenantes bacterium]|nr:hypothetical protein [Candidatus Aminicenantes bacterium]
MIALRRNRAPAAALALFLSFASGLRPGFGQEPESAKPWKPVLGLEYHSRTIAWDEKARSSTLGSAFLTAGVERRLVRGWSVTVFVGASLSNWNGLVFRTLPFSVEYQAGFGPGFLAGATTEATLARLGSWDIGFAARFLASLGASRSLDLAGLNETGTVEVRGTWLRLEAGPVLIYRGLPAFSPYVKLGVDRLWGRCLMDEKIRDLSGSEEKSVSGKGWVSARGGFHWELGPSWGWSFEASVLPFKKTSGGLGLDLGAALRAMVSL